VRLVNGLEDNIKVGLQEFGFDSMVQDMEHRSQCMVHSAETSISVQGEHLLGDCQLLYWMQFRSLEYDVTAAA